VHNVQVSLRRRKDHARETSLKEENFIEMKYSACISHSFPQRSIDALWRADALGKIFLPFRLGAVSCAFFLLKKFVSVHLQMQAPNKHD
jgi:hypothetical protein